MFFIEQFGLHSHMIDAELIWEFENEFLDFIVSPLILKES